MNEMFLTHPALATPHGFFTRHGGVSTGILASLNCRVTNRNPVLAELHKNVTAEGFENRTRAMAALKRSLDDLCVLDQEHGTNVITITEALPCDHKLVGDGLVTNTPGIVLGVMAADCAPILFHDPVAKVIGAAHSGWKGTLAGVDAATLEAMEKLGAKRSRIKAVIGPCIAQDSYEVGPDFPAPFIASGRPGYFIPSTKAGHFMFDLKGCVADGLQAAGIGEVAVIAQDTCANEANFFSNRRATLRKEPDFGLQLSAISLD